MKKASRDLPYGESVDFWAYEPPQGLLTAFVESVSRKPKIINVQDVPQDGWGEMGEIAPR